MNDRETLIATLENLVDKLSRPLSADESRKGWTEASQSAILSFLNDLRTKLLADETIPYLSIVRALDHWGVTGGELFQEAAKIDYGLRHTKQ